jgi:hypothetical protein
LPPSRVLRIVPASPTTQPRCPSLANVTAKSGRVEPLVRVCQELPPSRVLRIVPASPTTQPCCPSLVTITAWSLLREPLVWGCQELPPSRVPRIVPASPTAQPCCPSLVNAIASRWESTLGSRKKRFRSTGSCSHRVLKGLGSTANESEAGVWTRAIHQSTASIVMVATAIATTERSALQRVLRGVVDSREPPRPRSLTTPT